MMSPGMPSFPSWSGAPPALPLDLGPLVAWPARGLLVLFGAATVILVVSAAREAGRRLPELVGVLAAGTVFEPVVGVLLDVPAVVSDLGWRLLDVIVVVAARFSGSTEPRGADTDRPA